MQRVKHILLIIALALALAIAFIYQPFASDIASKPPAVESAALRNHVRHLSVDLHPRSADFPQNLDAAADYIKAQWQQAGINVTEQTFDVQGRRYRNIVAQFGPTANASHPVTVIGAHYDSHGDALSGAKHPQNFAKHTHTPGADDNASGVAGLIELGKMLAKNQPSKAIALVAYTLEEPPHYATPHMGSVKHAESLKATNQPVDLMVALEMIGYFNDAPNSQSYPVPGMGSLYPNTGNFIAIVSRHSDWQETRKLKSVMRGATPLPVYSINTTPMIPGVDFSDHRSYWQQGYPAVMVTDTAFMRNHEYHLAGDTFDKLDYARMAQVVQGVFAFAFAAP
jgi:Zn-dependent M28 family amino/carboxypeptidase